MLPGHPPPSAVNVFFYAQQNQIIRVKTAKPCQKSACQNSAIFSSSGRWVRNMRSAHQ